MFVYVTSMRTARIAAALITVRVILVLLEMVNSVPIRKSLSNDTSSLLSHARACTTFINRVPFSLLI